MPRRAMRLLRLILIAMLCLAVPAYGYVPPAAHDACASGAARSAAGAAQDAHPCCPDMGLHAAAGATGAEACAAACSLGGTCRTVGVLAPSAASLPCTVAVSPPDPGSPERIAAFDPQGFWRPPRA